MREERASEEKKFIVKNSRECWIICKSEELERERESVYMCVCAQKHVHMYFLRTIVLSKLIFSNHKLNTGGISCYVICGRYVIYCLA